MKEKQILTSELGHILTSLAKDEFGLIIHDNNHLVLRNCTIPDVIIRVIEQKLELPLLLETSKLFINQPESFESSCFQYVVFGELNGQCIITNLAELIGQPNFELDSKWKLSEIFDTENSDPLIIEECKDDDIPLGPISKEEMNVINHP